MTDAVNACIESCRMKLIKFTNDNRDTKIQQKQKVKKEIPITKVNGQECHKVHIQTSFFVAMLLTRQSSIGALTSLSANMRKVELSASAQTNDKNETLCDAMQHTDHTSFNESPFKSTHHIVDKPSPGGNNTQCDNFSH